MATAFVNHRAVTAESTQAPPLVADMGIEDCSPFGLQGLRRESIVLLKTEAVKQVAAALALGGARQKTDAAGLLSGLFERNPHWIEEYRVIHLIERSLWFEGRCDFVMQMIRNPSQIPDNPPAEIREALATAYTLHPEATVWYGIPLFGELKNSDGLPIPLTASQVREEAARRVLSAQNYASRLGWLYRTLWRIQRLPLSCRQICRRKWLAARGSLTRLVWEFRRARIDAKRRNRAAVRAQLEYARTGKSTTIVPEHTTRLGKVASRAAVTLGQVENHLEMAAAKTEEFFENHRYAAASVAVLPAIALQALPLFLAPAAIAACDPFLFIELPSEPGKLRMIGHWYWQPRNGSEMLHVHV